MYENQYQNNIEETTFACYVNKLLLFFLAMTCILVNCGCTNSTTTLRDCTPDHIEYTYVSYDEYGDLTSGVIGLASDNSSFIVTESFVKRYNSLISQYGSHAYFKPSLKRNAGITRIKDLSAYNSKYKTLYTINILNFSNMQLLVMLQKQDVYNDDMKDGND